MFCFPRHEKSPQVDSYAAENLQQTLLGSHTLTPLRQDCQPSLEMAALLDLAVYLRENKFLEMNEIQSKQKPHYQQYGCFVMSACTRPARTNCRPCTTHTSEFVPLTFALCEFSILVAESLSSIVCFGLNYVLQALLMQHA
ncbi:hypothetical protein KC19_6G209900 [Ceratodon purpureus]|uniref:Uncharacterized protein n=1 Tax=Ceratodon purpureus TaxID=3225 RepID=A0A8T0HJV1_CERPU|nr:hypothetical protein KC19_6G209900 [Ceratodon purpureus]